MAKAKSKSKIPRTPAYNKESVNKAIASSGRHGAPIKRKEAGAIHRLLKGRH